MSDPVIHPADRADDFAGMPHRASDVLIHLARTFPDDQVTIGALVDGLKDRAFGMLMLVLALPCCLPFLYGVPQVVSVPMLFVAVQIAIGRHTLWVPESLRKRSFSRAAFQDMAERAKKYIGWAEGLSQPRLSWLTRGVPERLFGVLMVIFCLSIAVPLPMTNTFPGIAVAIMSVGFIERDGLMVIAGAILGTLWVGFLVALAVSITVFGVNFLTGAASATALF